VVGDEVVEEPAAGTAPVPGLPVLGERVDSDAGPAEVPLQIIGRAPLHGVAAADIHEEPIPAIPEEVSDDELFVELGVELLAAGEDVIVPATSAPGYENGHEKHADPLPQALEDERDRAIGEADTQALNDSTFLVSDHRLIWVQLQLFD
jgi:hypothetical protein